jgi:hypothetical protein
MQVPIEYAYRIQETEPHMLVLWIHASHPTSFQQGYRNMTDKLLLPERQDLKADVLRVVHAWLADRRNGPWLMMLDSVDDDSVFFGNDRDGTGTSTMHAVHTADHGMPLESFLPQAARGTILITSMDNIAATNLVGGHGDVVQVEHMGEDEALALLHTRVPFNEANRADTEALVYALEGISLAITHAVACIKHVCLSRPSPPASSYSVRARSTRYIC